MAFSVPDLTYAFDALEPHIDARTMEIHHDKHHAAYVTNLNAALEGTAWADQSLEAVLRAYAAPDDEVAAAHRSSGQRAAVPVDDDDAGHHVLAGRPADAAGDVDLRAVDPPAGEVAE